MLLLFENKLILYCHRAPIKKMVMVMMMDLRVLSTVKMTNFMTHFHRVTTEFHQNQKSLFYFFSFGKLSIKFQTMGS